MKLGCCYYPEHWPEEMWAEDARRMVEMGLLQVRIGEFAWSRIEPKAGHFQWEWFDRAIETLSGAGLQIILGTPTATPPKWLVDSMPDMVAIDAHGNPRNFGSRRHYCFSHEGYREQCARIVTAMADRYGNHPAITSWQTDNEYGCHDTVLSYSVSARRGFRRWLGGKYDSIDSLNKAWGNVFWSMEYQSYDEIDLPHLTVTEPNPTHVLDYRRYASDAVVEFNKIQTDILRAKSPDRDIIHNYMGFYTEFDHHKVSKDLDVASWDSYPLGFLEQFWFTEAEKLHYARQGHPDVAAFHHDLYRGCCANGRWSVMEQQPGPVNWARYNPAPFDGMVRLWTLEAMAHGAELVSYFRWRQAAFAQEQMHAGLLRPDNKEAPGAAEAKQAAEDILAIGAHDTTETQKSVALIFSYEAAWLFETQPQGQSFRYIELVFEMYSALRKLGLNIDIVSPESMLDGYRMIIVPSLPILDKKHLEHILQQNVPTLFGPRTGSKTVNFAIPSNLPPGPLQSEVPLKVARVESLRNGWAEKGDGFYVTRWIEDIETQIPADITIEDGRGILFSSKKARYLAAWPPAQLTQKLFAQMAKEAGLATVSLHDDLRIRQLGHMCFAFNYGQKEIGLSKYLPGLVGAKLVIGREKLDRGEVAVWRVSRTKLEEK